MRASLAIALLALLALVGGSAAQDLDLGEDSPLDMLDDGLDMGLEEGPAKVDMSGLKASCYLPIGGWSHVMPAPKRRKDKAPEGEWHWREEGGDAVPLNAKPITTRIQVPEAGTYRLLLRQRMTPTDAAAVTLAIHPVTGETVGAAMHTHTFGAKPLDSTMTGKEHQRKRPLVFESEPAVLGMVTRPTTVWEYSDVELPAGTYELSLACPTKGARLTGLLITQATGFRPSMDQFDAYNTMEHVYLRYRVRDAVGDATHTVNAGLTYHWRGRSAPGSSEPIWGWPIGSVASTKTGEWTPFIDATEAIIPGPGPWSTCNMGVSGIRSGILEIEVAWRPEPSAVMYQLETGIGAGQARIRVPHGLGLGVDGEEKPAWGVWRQGHLARFVAEHDVVENYFAWAQEAMDRLGLPADHPRTKAIVINCSSRTTPAYNHRAAEMLAVLGVNWVHGASRDLIEKYDLVDGIWTANSSDYEGNYRRNPDQAAKVIRHKVGDEIHTFVDSGTVNNKPDLLAGFHAFLGEQAAAAGMSVQDYLGVSEPTAIASTTDLPARAGIFERRLYYLSNVYAHLASVPSYKATTDGFKSRFPNIEVYNNYSPHPLFLTGSTMNHSDWFVLTRNQAQTLAWGEDWATGGGWGLGTRYQCTSYYAALVAAAARRYDYPSGFYVGSNCGGSAYKIFSCAAQGLTRLHLYDWGPIDGWAEGSNSWSENKGEYYNIALATHALGPADTIVGEGERVQARVGILYNRAHEIWQGGTGRMNHDWMWTYIAANGASEPADVVTEDDLIGHIDGYQVLVIGGYNLSAEKLAAVKAWVAAGNTLVLTGGGGMYDLANDENTATTELAGVRQTLAGNAKEKESLSFQASPVTPAVSFEAHSRMVDLAPTTATPVATWADGSPAAVLNTVGQGRVLTLGFLPGHNFRDSGRGDGPVQTLITGLLRQTLGEPVARLSVPGAETTAFSHPSGMAVLVNLYYPPEGVETLELSVKPDRPITSVRSGLHGDLPFQKDGDRILIQFPTPAPVDTVILR